MVFQGQNQGVGRNTLTLQAVPAPGAPDIPGLMAASLQALPPSSHQRPPSVCPVFLCPSLIRVNMMAHMVIRDNFQYQDPNLITFAEILFQINEHLQVPRVKT